MQPRHLGQLLGDGQQRIERRHRILKDHRDLPPANAGAVRRLASSASRGPRNSARPPAIRAGGFGISPMMRQVRHALARAAFADDAERFARRDVERHAVDGAHDSRRRSETRREGLRLGEQRVLVVIELSVLQPAGSRASRRPSPRKFKAKQRRAERQAREDDEPPVDAGSA